MNQTSPSKVSVFDSSVALGSDDSNQNGDVNKSIDNTKKSDFISNLLKDRITLLKQQIIEKKKNAIIDFFCKIDFFVKQKISPREMYSNNNDDNRNINDRSKK